MEYEMAPHQVCEAEELRRLFEWDLRSPTSHASEGAYLELSAFSGVGNFGSSGTDETLFSARLVAPAPIAIGGFT